MQIIYKYPNRYATDSDSGKMYMVPLDFSEFVKPIFEANPNVDYIQLVVNNYVIEDSKTCLYENNLGDKCYKYFWCLKIEPVGIAFYKQKSQNATADQETNGDEFFYTKETAEFTVFRETGKMFYFWFNEKQSLLFGK